MTIKPLPPSRINVVGALIQSGKAVLIAQRATGELAGKWEFPGGKVESGETHQEALVREITEELGITIIVGGHVGSIDFEVATKTTLPSLLLGNCCSGRAFSRRTQ